MGNYYGNEAWENRNYINITRELFGEGTTIAFEGMLTEYLLNNTDFSKDAIRQNIIRRIRSSIEDARLVYVKLLFSRIKEEKGSIDLNDIEILMRNNNLSMQYVKDMSRRMFEDPRSMLWEKRYAIGGLIAPTIAKKYKEKGPEVIKDYIESVKNDDFHNALSVLEIEINDKGINELIKNMREQISILSIGER